MTPVSSARRRPRPEWIRRSRPGRPVEEARFEERDDSRDSIGGDGEHVDRVGAVHAIVAAQVERCGELSVGHGWNYAEVAGLYKTMGLEEARHHLGADEPGKEWRRR